MFNSVYAVRYRHKILAMLKVFMYVQLKVKIETIKGLLYIIETLKRLHNFLSFYEIYFVRQSFLYSLPR